MRPVRKLTYQDYCAFPDDGIRRELIAGELSVAPAPSIRHQRILLRLAVRIDSWLAREGGGEVFVAPVDAILSAYDVVQPDLVYINEADRERLTAGNLQGAPTLAAEIVSDSYRDRRLKLGLYARAGVREYWVVDPEGDQVEIHRLGTDGFGEAQVRRSGEVLTTDLIPGLVIDLADLFRRAG